MKVLNLKSKTDLLKLKKEISSYNNNIYFESYPINDLKEVRYNIVKSHSFLPKVVDSGPYKEYIDNRKISTCFRNLGGDVKLVIPIKPYPTIYDFSLNGSEKEWLALFNKVVNNFKKEDKFISTHGHGVAWIHVRIEKYPKYYKLDDLGNLIYKQLTEFDNIYNELNKYEKKINHWAWWVFPTEKSGKNEPYPKTCLPKNKIKEFLDSTDVSKWNKILILINKLIEKKGIEEVLPSQDLDRIRYFKKLFSKIKYDKYQYFLQTIKNIQI